MYFINSYFTFAAFLLLILGVISAILRRRSSVTTESRIKRMMVSCGIDEVTAIHADHVLKLDMNAVRTRCRHCPATELCDRWLDGEAVAGNEFCPNAWHFTKAAESRRLRQTSINAF